MVIGRGHVGRGAAAQRSVTVGAAIVLAVGLVACRSNKAPVTAKSGPSCRAVAEAAARFVDGAGEADREPLLRFAVEIVDLCQAPGLSPATRKCVASATSAEEARGCPALPVVPLRAGTPPATESDYVTNQLDAL